MLLRPQHDRFEQIGKEKRQQQNEESAARQIEDGDRGQEQSYSGDHVARAIVNPEHGCLSSISEATILHIRNASGVISAGVTQWPSRMRKPEGR
jgi:hypothetical protein